MTDEQRGRVWAAQQNHHPVGFPEFIPGEGPFWKTQPLTNGGRFVVWFPDAKSEADAYANIWTAVLAARKAVPGLVQNECGLVLDDTRVLRLHAAIAAALPYIETPHVRAALQNAIKETRS